MDVDVEEDEASRLLQALWRRRNARRNLLLLVRSIYKKHYDPASDTFYYVNNRTGEAKWTKPALLGDEELELQFPPTPPTRCNCMGRQFDASVWWVWEPEGPSYSHTLGTVWAHFRMFCPNVYFCYVTIFQ